MTFHFGRYRIPDWEHPRPALRSIACRPAPLVPGLVSRYWRMEGGSLEGLYLFRDERSWTEFNRQPGEDPAYRQAGALGMSAPIPMDSGELNAAPGLFERPVFIISAPRSGSTLLYELLRKSQAWWPLDSDFRSNS